MVVSLVVTAVAITAAGLFCFFSSVAAATEIVVLTLVAVAASL